MAPVHLCARSVCCAACAVPGALWLLFTGVRARCAVPRVRCPGPLGSWSPVCSLGVLCCVCGVQGLLAPVHWCARSVCCAACAVSGATGLLFTGVHVSRVLLCVWRVVCAVSGATLLPFAGVLVRCVVLRVLRPGPLGSRSPVCSLGVLCCVCGPRASWLLCSGVRTRCVVLRVRCSGPLGSCSPVCVLCVLCCTCGVLCVRCAPSCMHAAFMHSCHDTLLCCVCGDRGLLAPVHRCALVACLVLRVRCPGPGGSCSPVCCALVPCVACCVRCPGPHGSCSPVCLLGVLRGVCGVAVGVCSRVPYRPRCIFRCAQE